MAEGFDQFEARICDLFISGAVCSKLESGFSEELNRETHDYLNELLKKKFNMYHCYVWSRQWPHEIAHPQKEEL